MKFRNMKMGMLAITVMLIAVVTHVLSLKLTQTEAEKRLKEADICIHQPCGEKENIDCTSLDGIEESTVSDLVELKKKSGCSVVVTSGTEASKFDIVNYSHDNGRGVTIRNGSCIYNYITSHVPCKRFVAGNRTAVVGCEDDHYNLYTLRSQWKITFYGKDRTFLERLTRELVGFNSTYIN